MLLGAHMSIAGGLHKALERGKSVGCDIVQIFVKSSNQWKAKPLTDEDIRLFSDAKKATGISIVVGHTSYLINVASPDPLTYRKSLEALRLELERAEALGIPFLVLHPGSHMGEGEQAGLNTIAESLDKVHAGLPGLRVKIALEITAGQGTNLGFRFEHLAQIIGSVREPERLAVCFDTCHAFAAGYDIRTKKAYTATMQQFDEILGLDRLAVIHLNDAKKELASRIDRHEHIGKGHIGLDGFRWLLNDKRLQKIPMSLETHKGKDLKEDIENLATLRSLIKRR
ncbi:MAG: deoxyribonuclease IV [Verrucomicrobia bacterium]|nr:deoxyribonuclease IV [Verrucomicrobiota bacterium]